MTICVTFHHEETGNCVTTFQEVGRRRFFNRNFDGEWFTTVSDYWESCTPIKEGTQFFITDPSGSVVYCTEQVGLSPSFTPIDRWTREQSLVLAEQMNLATYEQWKKHMTDHPAFSGYGDMDNYLYAENEKLSSYCAGELSYIGKSFRIVVTKYRHKLCDVYFEYVELLGSDDAVAALCGYRYGDHMPDPVPVHFRRVGSSEHLMLVGLPLYWNNNGLVIEYRGALRMRQFIGNQYVRDDVKEGLSHLQMQEEISRFAGYDVALADYIESYTLDHPDHPDDRDFIGNVDITGMTVKEVLDATGIDLVEHFQNYHGKRECPKVVAMLKNPCHKLLQLPFVTIYKVIHNTNFIEHFEDVFLQYMVCAHLKGGMLTYADFRKDLQCDKEFYKRLQAEIVAWNEQTERKEDSNASQ